MLQDYSGAARQLVRNQAGWQAGVFKPIHNANAAKFFELFDEAQRRYIQRRSPFLNIRSQRVRNPSLLMFEL
jgi:hypothetical protein